MSTNRAWFTGQRARRGRPVGQGLRRAQSTAQSGAALLWRTRSNAKLPLEQALSDGSYLSRIYASEKARRQKRMVWWWALLDEFKTHRRGGQVVLPGKTSQLIEQEFYGMMLAHRAVRTLMITSVFRQLMIDVSYRLDRSLLFLT